MSTAYSQSAVDLILRDKVRAFRADPDVQAAVEASRVMELWEPTIGQGETLATLRAETHDIDALAKRGMHFEHLDQLALEHLYGVR